MHVIYPWNSSSTAGMARPTAIMYLLFLLMFCFHTTAVSDGTTYPGRVTFPAGSKQDPVKDAAEKEKLVAKIQEEVNLVLDGSSNSTEVALVLWDNGVKTPQDFVYLEVLTINDFPMLKKVEAIKMLRKLKERGIALQEPTTPKPGISKTIIPATPKPGISKTPIPTTPKPGISKTHIPTTPKPDMSKTLIPTTSKSGMSKTPMPATPKPGISTTPIPTTPKPDISKTPLPTTPKPGMSKTPIPTTAKPDMSKTPLPTTPNPDISKTPIPTTPKPLIENTPPNTNGTSTTTTVDQAKGQTIAGQQTNVDNDKPPGSVRLFVFILFAILVLLISYMAYTKRSKIYTWVVEMKKTTTTRPSSKNYKRVAEDVENGREQSKTASVHNYIY